MTETQTFALSIATGSRELTIGKKCTPASFARVVAFGSKGDREGLATEMYALWFQSGTYRPIVKDILNCGLLTATEAEIIGDVLPLKGSIKKADLARLCTAIVNKVERKGKEVKGQKAYMLTMVKFLAKCDNDVQPDGTVSPDVQ